MRLVRTSSGAYLTPNVARIQDYLDGGTDNYAVDRDLADELLAAARWLPGSVRINRAHGRRILDAFTRELGIDQVLDLGCGLPHLDNRQLPDAVQRIIYIDNDPGVAGHANVYLAERHGTDSFQADLTDTKALLAAPAVARLDHGRPIGVLLHDVLPWLGDEDARSVLAELRDWLPPGSALSLTHATADFAREIQMTTLTDIYAHAGIVFRPRTAEQIHTLLGRWALPEGERLVSTAEWRSPSTYERLDHSHAYATIALPWGYIR
ncbi:SAM-dependent methyltransferase [Streptomyces sp. H27-H1]|uniref:SAM-dependent methyltransferase n=1 Tax=Streptomyces sp. H27-H1 TaxID=2996461 RepID=UPI0022717D7B|nr:SAM-dependent methyltransferase [Streptomyces sp. H27-H1]MCY0932108.1 SAM-dependent methyltransferase [Streptomyces sp. H27-H1]